MSELERATNKAIRTFRKKKHPLRPQVSVKGTTYAALFYRSRMQGLRLSLLVDVLVNHELDRLERMCEDQ